MARVAGKIALVTGGASGLGAAAARLLAEEGAKVALTDIAEESGEAAARLIIEANGEALFLRQNTAIENDWKHIVKAIVQHWGRLDILVNNAGVAGDNASITETSMEEWRRVLTVNLDGVFLGIKHCAPAIIASGGGSVINLSSILGKVGFRGAGAYCASKGGVALLTKSAALELAEFNVRVNSIHPGFIDTPMAAKGLAGMANPNKSRQRIEAAHPVGHLGEPKDIAEGVLFLASDASRFMTGAELVVDGGYTAQ
jgi:NAD(P)-dependent dehydrogenase (short-subunit alcohol dehydrogenase family)